MYYHSNLFEDCQFWFRNASARENHSTREKATRGGEREHFSLSPLRLAFLALAIMALAIVGISAKRSWGPENELRCSFCKEERMATEQNLKHCRIVGPIFLAIRPFTVLYFSVRLSRDRALCVTGCHLARVSNLLRGQGRFGRRPENIFLPPPPLHRAIIPDTRPLGTFENQDTRDGNTRYI